LFRVEVSVKPDLPDPRGEALKADVRDLGIGGVQQVRVSDVYLLEGKLTPQELETICSQLLADPIVEAYATGETPLIAPQDARAIEVAYNPGVMDPVEESVSKGIRDLGITSLESVRTAKRYYLWGRLSNSDIELISNKLLVNSVIQHVVADGEKASLPSAGYEFSRIEVELLSLDDDGLTKLGREKLELNLNEMKQIQGYFSKLGRNPTDVELETLSQTWSEHCKHKTFNSRIRLGDEVIDNLLKSTIMRVTRELDKPWCLSTFKDNSGVIDFDGRYALCFKVETHNHPSAIEPYGGASTGLGGVIRDPLGTGLGSKPIASTDVFCFAPPDFPHNKLPEGVLHPRRILKGVRAGVADYGNRLGIPTLNGAILFDERYLGNPIVLCGTVGLMPKTAAQMGRQHPGDKVVVVGGKTGRDGIHGVTFASALLTGESEEVSASSVQIGDPITEKKMIDVLLRARDRNTPGFPIEKYGSPSRRKGCCWRCRRSALRS